MSNTIILDEIVKFFSDVDKKFGRFVDYIELKPIYVGEKVFITSFKRKNALLVNEIDVHIKEIVYKTDKEKEEWYMVDSKKDIWLPIEMLDETIVTLAFRIFEKDLLSLQTIYTTDVSYTENGEAKTMFVAYQNKKQACKMSIALRKDKTNIRLKFKEYRLSSDGKYVPLDKYQGEGVVSDFELVTQEVCV